MTRWWGSSLALCLSAVAAFSPFWVVPVAKQDVTVELRYNSVWNDHTSDVLVQPPITVTPGREDESQQPAPARATLRFKGWAYNPQNPASALYGLIGRYTGLRITVGSSIRFVGEVASWTPRQTLGGNSTPFRWVEVEAADVTRRLGTGTDPLENTVHRYLDKGAGATNLVAYWPLRGGGPRVMPAVRGGPMRMLLPNQSWGTDEMSPWLGPAATMRGDVALDDPGAPAAARLAPGAPVRLVFDVALRLPQARLPRLAGHMVRLEAGEQLATDLSISLETLNLMGVGETIPVWQLRLWIRPAAVVFVAVPFPSIADGQMHHVRTDVTVNPGTGLLTYVVSVDGTAVISSTDSSSFANLAVATARVVAYTDQPGTVVFSDLAVWAGTPPALADTLAAYRGHAGEHAGDRIDRLADEEGILFSVVAGTAADTVPLGPQYPDGLMAVAREAAAADDGTLTGHRQTLGALAYYTGRARYNQDAVLELDYDAEELAPALEPVLDDQGTRNDVTVTRRDGGSVQAVDEVSVAAVGRVATSVTLNLLGDGLLGDAAGWRLHLGGPQGLRFPRLSVDLVASPGLTAAVDALELNDRITVANLPSELTPDLASLLLLGWTEVIGNNSRRFIGNMAAEAPYHVAEVEHDDYSHIGPDPAWGFTTSASFTSGTSTSMGVAFTGTQPGFLGADVPFDILVAGVRLHVTATSGASSPNVLTCDQAPVNGIVKVIPAGTPVGLFHPAYIGL
jgi:hypothetical protein